MLEIGTFGGYSALAMAAGLAPGGRIVTCEMSPVHAEFARRHIAASPYADRIEVIVGPAIDTIASLEGPFDFVFLDADKAGYRAYYEAVLPKLAPRGLIAADNTLWSGRCSTRRTPPPTPSPCGGSTTSWPPTPGWWRSRRRSATASPSSAGPAEPGRHRRKDLVLDYHLHLWPHSQSDAQTTVDQVAAYCERAVAQGVTEIAVTEHLFRFTQAKDRLGGFWDDLPGTRSARAWPPTGTTTPESTSTTTSKWCRP